MSSSFIDINLLAGSRRGALQQTMWQRMVLPGLVVLALALLLVIGTSLLKLRNDRRIVEQRVELQAVSEEVRTMSSVMAEVWALQEQVTLLASQARELRDDAAQVEGRNVAVAPFLDLIQSTLLPRMEITAIAGTSPTTYVVQGTAGSDLLVIDYANQLRESDQVREAVLRSVESLGEDALPGSVRWTIEVER
ncbi:MAG: hypothetical protein KDD73_09625 [Anaerolineales bacterium]|nr:hypothetical protein [Anaerolineales bacterium]MCB9127248.1 hypothetical protein [Ardenticatenales bacterium]MCB9172935.1 hypothetical protein [Ardenticatenales bacterium]